jgi:DNA-binding transcriptional LysR family regulator
MFDDLQITGRDMSRNLDLTALRSFVTVAETGGVTRAAGLLNLTQSAVSMQIKRLEESLGLTLLDRSGRGVALTPAGEQLLSYARRLVALNDEAWGQLTRREFEGEITLGVPYDIVYPAIPRVLRRFARDYPRMRVSLISSFTRKLKQSFARGEVDLILTTEDSPMPGSLTLAVKPLVWMGALDGQAWQERPLSLAFTTQCICRPGVQRRLDEAGIPWRMAVESDSTAAVEATVSADLGVHALIEGHAPPHLQQISHGGQLPDLGAVHINLYARESALNPAHEHLFDLVRSEFGAGHRVRAAEDGAISAAA